MLGFTQYSPGVLSLLIDRGKYKPLIMTNALPASLKRLAEFLANQDTRSKVIMFTSVDVLLDIVEEDFDLQTSKIVVMDTISNLFKVTDNVRDVKKRGTNFQFLSLVPNDLNQALSECSLGLQLKKTTSESLPLEEISLKTKVAQRNLNNNTELRNIIQEAITHLGNKEKGEASEDLLKFVTGIFSKKKIGIVCRAYDIQPEPLKKLMDYISSYKGKALRTVFMDINIFHTAPGLALQETKANKLDYDYLTTLLPIGNEYEFALKPPKVLLNKLNKRTTSTTIQNAVVEKDELDAFQEAEAIFSEFDE